jgi:hypothetical protein
MSQFIMVSQTFQYGYWCYEGQRKWNALLPQKISQELIK